MRRVVAAFSHPVVRPLGPNSAVPTVVRMPRSLPRKRVRTKIKVQFGARNALMSHGNESRVVQVVFLPDNTEVMAEPGEVLSDVARRAGVEIIESCGVGDCGTCEVLLRDEFSGDGFYIKSCVTKVPSHKDKLVIDTVGDSIPPW